jgi:hypothetical protein
LKHLNYKTISGKGLKLILSFLYGSLPDKKRVEGDNQVEAFDRMKMV